MRASSASSSASWVSVGVVPAVPKVVDPNVEMKKIIDTMDARKAQPLRAPLQPGLVRAPVAAGAITSPPVQQKAAGAFTLMPVQQKATLPKARPKVPSTSTSPAPSSASASGSVSRVVLLPNPVASGSQPDWLQKVQQLSMQIDKELEEDRALTAWLSLVVSARRRGRGRQHRSWKLCPTLHDFIQCDL